VVGVWETGKIGVWEIRARWGSSVMGVWGRNLVPGVLAGDGLPEKLGSPKNFGMGVSTPPPLSGRKKTGDETVDLPSISEGAHPPIASPLLGRASGSLTMAAKRLIPANQRRR
jgi:hypothetical protein